MADPYRPFVLRSLHWMTRLGLSLLVLVLAGGLISSALFMHDHYEGRDGVPGMTKDDILGAYHGVHSPSPLIRILEEGHADGAIDAAIPAKDKSSLLAWLKGDSSQLSQQYDNFDLGDMAPVEILTRNCESCHSRDAITSGGDTHGTTLSLAYWDDVDGVAHSRDVSPSDPAVVLASMHTHSLSLGMLSMLIVLLACGTRWSREWIGYLAVFAGAGLAVDLGSWFLAREHAGMIWGIIGGGFAFVVADSLMLALILLDLWRPQSASETPAD